MKPVRVLELPQDVLDSARLTLPELKVELAVHLYAEGRLSIWKGPRSGRHDLVGIPSIAGCTSHPASLR